MPYASGFLMAAALLPLASAAQAAPVVVVEYRLDEQSAERIEDGLVTPLERALVRLPGIASVHSLATHGRARFEIGFPGGASEHALAAVKAEVARFDEARGIGPAALVEVALPYLESGFLAPAAAPDDGKRHPTSPTGGQEG